jgi:hypothetical protein
MKKATASLGGSLGALIGLVIGLLIPVYESTPFFTRITGGAIMDNASLFMGGLVIIIAVLICGAFGAIIGSLSE